MNEQRNPYKGFPPRPWVHLRLLAPEGTSQEIELLADTGNPCSIIISLETMDKFKLGDAPDLASVVVSQLSR